MSHCIIWNREKLKRKLNHNVGDLLQHRYECEWKRNRIRNAHTVKTLNSYTAHSQQDLKCVVDCDCCCFWLNCIPHIRSLRVSVSTRNSILECGAIWSKSKKNHTLLDFYYWWICRCIDFIGFALFVLQESVTHWVRCKLVKQGRMEANCAPYNPIFY